MNSLSPDYKNYLRDILRLAVLGVLAWWLLRGDYSLSTIAVSTGVSLLVVAVSHFVRRIAFPQINLFALAEEAMKAPIGAALVFCAIVYFLVAVVNLQGGLLVGMLK